MANEFYITQEGLEELKKKYEYYTTVRRKEASEHIKEARSFGDLSENAEYDAAKEEQALVEIEIQKMQMQIENAVIIQAVNSSVVSLGSKVKIHDLDMDEIDDITIVGQAEASVANNRISNESPLAKALMGKKAGDTVTVKMPEMEYDVKIMEVGR